MHGHLTNLRDVALRETALIQLAALYDFSSSNPFCEEILLQVSKPITQGGNDTILSNELYSMFQL